MSLVGPPLVGPQEARFGAPKGERKGGSGTAQADDDSDSDSDTSAKETKSSKAGALPSKPSSAAVPKGLKGEEEEVDHKKTHHKKKSHHADPEDAAAPADSAVPAAAAAPADSAVPATAAAPEPAAPLAPAAPAEDAGKLLTQILGRLDKLGAAAPPPNALAEKVDKLTARVAKLEAQVLK
jgi:hypothetical protein